MIASIVLIDTQHAHYQDIVTTFRFYGRDGNTNRVSRLKFMLRVGCFVVFMMCLVMPNAGQSQESKEPGWTGGVIKLGSDRTRTRSTPITQRPYRPFHFYGNTVRRLHYRGTAIPNPRDFFRGTAALVRPRGR